MSRPLSGGQQLLASVAAAYRQEPKSWCAGWGLLPNGDRASDPEGDPDSAVLIKPCCIDVMLIKLGPKTGDRKAVHEARALLYAHLADEKRRGTIWSFNDKPGRTVDQVIACVEGAAGVTVVPESGLLEFVAKNSTAAKQPVAVAA